MWLQISVVHCSIWLLVISVSPSLSSYLWSATDEWGPCSAQCGAGDESQIFECLKKTLYGTKESAKPIKCDKIKSPVRKRKCSLGACPVSSNSSFVWVVGNWSQCPKTCGNSALKSRDVSCYLMTNNGKLLPSKLSKCNYKIEPARFISCAKTDCPPVFLASKWGKCSESKSCGKSVRRRNVQCISVLKNGKYKILKAAFCYRMHLRPPSSWSVCASENDKNCKNLVDIKRIRSSVTKIEKEEADVYQMRPSKRMKLFVGQTAFVFMYTKLSIVCPAEGFPHRLLKWSHNGTMYEYTGDSSDRVRVNRRGVLIIREFLMEDEGVWRCHAGKSAADAIVKQELPSNGFRNWIKRHSNQNHGMFNEESKGAFIMPDSLMWMKSDWSKCSVTCGKDAEDSGTQVRKVSCEKIDAKYYKIIDDKFCSNPKPISKRKCKSTMSCPVWRVENSNDERCTDQCVNIGFAKMNTNVYCDYESRTVDSSFCDTSKRPNATCPNSNCKVKYQYGAWSQCSLSCSNTTNVSIRSRTMHCVWQHDGMSAYNLCQLYNISHYALTKSCRVPKCILGCQDLTLACQIQSKYRCRSSLFNHFCCAFCRHQNQYY